MVRRALTALKDQTYKDFSVVFLDDQSPEDFESLATEFRPHFPIEIRYNSANLGAMQNIWQSITLDTTTPYILSHHADDYLKVDYLEKAIAILEADTTVSFVVTGPVWVAGDHPYEAIRLGDTAIEYFGAADFAKNILNFAPYIFGSVVYRRSHLIADWRYADMDTYCDRYFMGEILRTHKSKGAYIHGNGIIEHDHSLDVNDHRSPKLNEDHAINLLAFYRELLRTTYNARYVNKIITNATLYYFSNFASRSSLYRFYQKQRHEKLIAPLSIRTLGLYSLVALFLPTGTKRALLRIRQKIKRARS
jgi:glycosyltransferase involved in cell wall biosynthesis